MMVVPAKEDDLGGTWIESSFGTFALTFTTCAFTGATNVARDLRLLANTS